MSEERSPFLSARWSHLTLFTFEVPRSVLEPRLPEGVSLDTRDGRAFASVVGLDFHETRVLGVGWPGFRDFADINFRFYARKDDRRGVVFLREIVPHRFVSWVARVVYDEPFRHASVSSRAEEDGERVSVERRFELQGRENVLRVTGRRPAFTPSPDSFEHFLKERAWGFGRDRHGATQAFLVAHPPWECLAVESSSLDLDWSTVYGPEWEFLRGREPANVALALGSRVGVFPREPL
ncbi:DUF2071 domain-containing protein [bacterium]|nr:DUF2071 domain-containing protein [bacterium]